MLDREAALNEAASEVERVAWSFVPLSARDDLAALMVNREAAVRAKVEAEYAEALHLLPPRPGETRSEPERARDDMNARVLGAEEGYAEVEGALRDCVKAHEALYEPLVEWGILGDPQYGEPHVPNSAYIAEVDAYETARALLPKEGE
ncbi:hypothetical protein LCGC14_1816670 [marine sediment metagenome]|uniref:Uncharacterized protein n=1 Tax=marine sediment metagenome TaxID=412755 RepID=A0A0F9GK60_9ZZZZ